MTRLPRLTVLAGATAALVLLTSCAAPEPATDRSTSTSIVAQNAAAITLPVPTGAPGTAFWDVFEPPPPSAAAGDVYAAQPRTDAPEGSQGWTLVYVSEVREGTKAYVSGEVYVPTTPSATARDIVLWNHETTGLADSCAPSRRTLTDQRVPGIADLLDQGRIVVMSDYPGQGLPGPVYYMAGQPNARASLDLVKAVRNLRELNASSRFVQYGWSQGGQTTMHAEAIAKAYAPGLEGLGSGLIAPAVRIHDLTARSMTKPELAGYVIATLVGIKTAYPDLNYRSFLRPESMEKLSDVHSGCWDLWSTAGDIKKPYTYAALKKGTGWKNAMLEVDRFTPAGSMPFVVYQGTADVTTPVELTKREFERLCAAGSAVEYREFPGLDHEPVVPEAAKLFPAWAQERFQGAAARSDCS